MLVSRNTPGLVAKTVCAEASWLLCKDASGPSRHVSELCGKKGEGPRRGFSGTCGDREPLVPAPPAQPREGFPPETLTCYLECVI